MDRQLSTESTLRLGTWDSAGDTARLVPNLDLAKNSLRSGTLGTDISYHSTGISWSIPSHSVMSC